MAQRRLPGASTGRGADTEKVGRAIDKAAADSGTKAIILHVDSPGGSVAGTAELAAKVRAARDRKPVIAQVDSQAASAAYWVASQATEVVSTPGGSVGSIGVVALHEDISAMLEAEGVRPTLISAGKYKVEGHPFAPLEDEAREHFQSVVDDSYRDFVGAVASGRGVTTKVVESKYGQGRVLFAQRALTAGMVDRIATFDQTLARFRAPQPSIQRRARAAQAIART
jgi:signal peptide peptidase SppA